MIKCGVDLVFIPEFEERARRGGEGFLRKIFLESELKNTESAHLAGVFAAKEALLKALGAPVGSWHKIEISYDANGRPKARILGKGIKSCDLSISHTGDYAIAVSVVSLRSLQPPSVSVVTPSTPTFAKGAGPLAFRRRRGVEAV